MIGFDFTGRLLFCMNIHIYSLKSELFKVALLVVFAAKPNTLH